MDLIMNLREVELVKDVHSFPLITIRFNKEQVIFTQQTRQNVQSVFSNDREYIKQPLYEAMFILEDKQTITSDELQRIEKAMNIDTIVIGQRTLIKFIDREMIEKKITFLKNYNEEGVHVSDKKIIETPEMVQVSINYYGKTSETSIGLKENIQTDYTKNEGYLTQTQLITDIDKSTIKKKRLYNEEGILEKECIEFYNLYNEKKREIVTKSLKDGNTEENTLIYKNGRRIKQVQTKLYDEQGIIQTRKQLYDSTSNLLSDITSFKDGMKIEKTYHYESSTNRLLKIHVREYSQIDQKIEILHEKYLAPDGTPLMKDLSKKSEPESVEVAV